MLPTRLVAVFNTLIEMAINFTEEDKENIFTNDETTQALLNKGYRHKLSHGFHAIELTGIIFKKYEGDLIINYKKDFTGCVAYLDDEEIFDSATFDSASHLGNALGHLLLMLDNKFKKEDDTKTT